MPQRVQFEDRYVVVYAADERFDYDYLMPGHEGHVDYAYFIRALRSPEVAYRRVAYPVKPGVDVVTQKHGLLAAAGYELDAELITAGVYGNPYALLLKPGRLRGLTPRQTDKAFAPSCAHPREARRFGYCAKCGDLIGRGGY